METALCPRAFISLPYLTDTIQCSYIHVYLYVAFIYVYLYVVFNKQMSHTQQLLMTITQAAFSTPVLKSKALPWKYMHLF